MLLLCNMNIGLMNPKLGKMSDPKTFGASSHR